MDYFIKIFVAVLSLLLITSMLQAQKFKSYLPTPPMGWNSWNTFFEDISEAKIMEVADAFISSGLKDAGYLYVNIDDGWALERSSDGTIIPDPKKFPRGMKYVADYVHSKGLKFGIYTAPGEKTCAKFVGSLGFEQKDVETYAAWGVDYIKLDGCGAKESREVICKKWRDALDKVARPIVLSVHLGYDDVAFFTNYANLWRTTNDVYPAWDLPLDQNVNWKPLSIAPTIDMQQGLEEAQSPGTFNDPDMLQVGNGALSNEENKMHLGMWAMLGAPLLLGNDVRKMSKQVREIVTNKEIIAINQDPLCYQGRKISDSGIGKSKLKEDYGLQVFVKKLAGDGEYAVALFNRSEFENTMTVRWADIGLDPQNVLVRDLWQLKDLGKYKVEYSTKVAPHSATILKVKGVSSGEIRESYPMLKDSIVLEAEEGALFRAVKANFYKGYAGPAYVQYCSEPPTQFTRMVVNIPEEGIYKVGVRYTNVNGNTCNIHIEVAKQSMKLACPVPKDAKFTFAFTGSATWDYAFSEINLKKGLNVIKVSSKEVLSPLIDQIIIKK
jgi:alpha-galactosidase